MRKICKFFAFFTMALLPIMTSAQKSTLTVSDGTDVDNEVPLNFTYPGNGLSSVYGRCQFIYTASKVSNMSGKVITGLKFYTVGGTANSNFSDLIIRVKMGTCAIDHWYGSIDWKTEIPSTVYVGPATFNSSDHTLSIYLNTGYYYDGTGPLLIEFENLTSGTGQSLSSYTGFYGLINYGSVFYALHYYSSTYPVSYISYSVYNSTKFTPKCTFTYQNPVVEDGRLHDDFYSSYASSNDWISLNPSHGNYWMVGDSANTNVENDTKGLYVSGYPTGGNRYLDTTASKSFVYKFVNLEAFTDYAISYDWKCNGESSYDYMRVALVPTSTTLSAAGMVPDTATGWTTSSLPSGVIPLDKGSKLNLHNTWQHMATTFRTGSTTNYRLVFYWCNDGSVSNQSPAAVDRIRIVKLQKGSFHDDFEQTDGWKNWVSEVKYFDSWNIGTDAGSSNGVGTNSYHVGNDAGHVFNYTNDSYQVIYGYVPIRLKAGRYLVNYDWKCQGEGSYDYMNVGFAPFYSNIAADNTSAVTFPTGTIRADSYTNLSGQSNWQHKSLIVQIPTDTVYNFFVRWRNDNSGGNYPGAIDNVSISPINESFIGSTDFGYTYWNSNGRYWTFANGAQKNRWMRSSTSPCLHVSNNPSTETHSYNNTSTSTSFVYSAVQVTAGDYRVAYNWECNGESNYDYLRVALLPADAVIAPGNYNFSANSLPVGAIPLDGGSKHSLSNNWTSFADTITVATSGVYKLVLFWRNDASGGNNPPAAFDDLSISAVESVTNYTITTNSNNTSWGTVTGGGTYAEGSSVTLTATPASGYHFVQWQDGNTSNPRTITVTGNATYTATFAANAPNQYTITVTSNNDAWGTVTGGGTYDDGTTVTIAATARTGYKFVEWSDGDNNASRDITVVCDSTFNAIFAENNGIADVDVPDAVSLYPNPASSTVTVGLSGLDGEYQLSVTDLTGRTMHSQTVGCNGDASVTLDVSNLAPGAYYVRLTGDSFITIKKFVVK